MGGANEYLTALGGAARATRARRHVTLSDPTLKKCRTDARVDTRQRQTSVRTRRTTTSDAAARRRPYSTEPLPPSMSDLDRVLTSDMATVSPPDQLASPAAPADTAILNEMLARNKFLEGESSVPVATAPAQT